MINFLSLLTPKLWGYWIDFIHYIFIDHQRF
jgi:hypothetical protein